MLYSELRVNNDDILDLTDGYVVLGSGLSAIATIHGILDQSGTNKPKIYVLDAGLGLSSKVQWSSDNRIKMPSPKFKGKKVRHIYDYFHTALGITEKNFNAIGSLAKGGLSNIWGATIQPYSKEELADFPYEFEDVSDIYAKIEAILTTDPFPHKAEVRAKSLGPFEIYEPRLAIHNYFGKDGYCDLHSCDVGCIGCNRLVYNSGQEIDHLSRTEKIKYLPGVFIESINKNGDLFLVTCRDVESGGRFEVRSKNIFSCLGTISTTKVVLNMTATTTEVPLLTTPGGAFFLFSLKENSTNSSGILASKSYSGRVDGEIFCGNIFPVSQNLLEAYFGQVVANLTKLIFGPWLLSRIFVANIYFSSDLGGSEIRNEKQGLVITGASHKARLRQVFRNAMALTSKNLINVGLRILPLSKKLLEQGQDIHYGGTLPMKANPVENQCSLSGELFGFKGFFIADSSSMPYLAGKGQSFNSMVNSYYIATKALEADL